MNGSTAVTAINNPKTIRAWYMYDWANSVYSLVITSAIFPVYYKAVAKTNGSDDVSFFGIIIKNSSLYSYALSFSFLIVALILPLLSGMADYTGNKKAYMKMFMWLGSLSCMGLYFFNDVSMLEWGILCSVLASIGYSGSLVFYDAFLPEIVTEDRYDTTSARGFSMGYYGSIVLMVVCLILILNHGSFGFEDEGAATRFSFLLVGTWWIGFSFIPFSLLPNNPYNRRPAGRVFTKGYEEIRKVWISLREQQDLKRYLIAFFFYNMGVQTVMYLAALFGTDVLFLESSKLIQTVLLIQLVGSIGAWLFASVSKSKGNMFALYIMISIWIIICVAAYFVTNEYHFYALAFVVGMVMGGIQALSRATYAKLIPSNTIDHASYFSFYDVTFNLSIVFGTFSYGFIDQITHSMRYSALALGVYFIVGGIILSTVKARQIREANSIR
ncbi:MFS transporter [Chryseosolibacter indicus]|uniref:MFS transporter n=1 Tax=Chryseosolibacter indicus TaxID=2782351 RepID=A0ABS5VRN5_9BACT|nr:MFS transporter [Chryseosolibacter indicus]MBT1703490.1 MFS transporter [Chryseosolibacter indicus]